MSRGEQIDPQWNDPSSYGGGLPPDWDIRRKRVYRRDDWTCTRCGHQSGPYAEGDGTRLHAHHVVPRSEGGSNQLSNLTTLCESCHNEVHDHDIFVSDGWVGDTGRGTGLGGRLIRALKFFGATVIGFFCYLFAVLVALNFVSPTDAPLWSALPFPPTWWAGLAAVILLGVLGAMLWRPLQVLLSSVLSMGGIALFATVVMPQIGFSRVIVLIEIFTAVPAVGAFLVYGLKRLL